MGMTIPVTKHNFKVKDPKLLVPAIREACEVARAGRPGPVLIDINGEKKLIGIVSYGDQSCSVYAVSSSVPDPQAWIDETLHPKEEKKGCAANVFNTRDQFSVFYPILLFLFGIFVTQTPRKRRH